MLHLDWQEIFTPNVSVVEIVLRRNMRVELSTEEELCCQLRRRGVLSLEGVDAAYYGR